MIQYKRNEGAIVKAFMDYIDGTYSAHYASGSGRDVVDDWQDMGIAREAFQSNIVKYSKRFGKKEGDNPKDIIKIMHYCVFLLNEIGYADSLKNNEDVNNDEAYNEYTISFDSK